MTFKFEVDNSKKPDSNERRLGAGLGTARDYTDVEQRDGMGTFHEPQTQFFSSRHTHDSWEREPQFALVPAQEPEVNQEEYNYAADWVTETEHYSDLSALRSDFGGSYHTRRPSYWWKLALSIAGALGIGILLGYAALSFIGGGSLTGSPHTPRVNSAVQGGKDTSAVLPQDISKTAGVTPISVQVPAQTYYLLQYGVFSTPAGAEQARQELLAAGLAAGVDPAYGNRVYAGMSPDREQAKLLSSGLKNQGIELYVKEISLPAAAEAVYTGQAVTVNNYFAASGNLLGKLSRLSAAELSGQEEAADSTEVSTLHMQWAEAFKALEPGLPAEAQKLCAGLEKSMSQGISALNEYNKNQAQGLLWEVQEAMMSFLSGQKSLLAAMT